MKKILITRKIYWPKARKKTKGKYYLKTTDEFKSNTLLLRIGGKVVSNIFIKENRYINKKEIYLFSVF